MAGTKKVAIVQSNYIPWKGYFDLINRVDEFVLYDNAQYTKNDWRNRNIIKTPQGPKWLTIPVQHLRLDQQIRDTKIADYRWARKHWTSISQNYARSEFFQDYGPRFEQLYKSIKSKFLSEVNFSFIVLVNELLGIQTRIRWSSEFDLVAGRTERLIDICRQIGASEYISGPAATAYFDCAIAEREGIKVSWMDYSSYPPYTQLHPPFDHNVTVLDLLFNMGAASPQYMNGSRFEQC